MVVAIIFHIIYYAVNIKGRLTLTLLQSICELTLYIFISALDVSNYSKNLLPFTV